ncbi:MAG: endonuclease/exonuclease/phosphatase family protein [Armatimonadetes bacterium]|nr:endonuclease/exonuclease/phosphatase family protein [Armatimonadota bacterium]
MRRYLQLRNQGSDSGQEVIKVSRFRLVLLFAYYAFLLIAYASYLPHFAVITVFPSWSWCILGWLFTISIPLKSWGKNLKLAFLLSLVVLLFTSEEIYAPVRWVMALGSKASEAPYMVSLNCAGGSVAAAQEAVDTKAEFIFLQESPSEAELIKIGKPQGYAVYWGVDGSILSKQSLSNVRLQKEMDYTSIKSDQIALTSIRLEPPIFRLDVWNPENWRVQRDRLIARRARFAEIIEVARSKGVPTFIAGDFNAAPTQTSSRRIANAWDIGDAHSLGWGGTAVNEFPFVRIDRIWRLDAKPDSIRTNQIKVRRTENSDHRMVLYYRD